MNLLPFVIALGFALSTYAFYVEYKTNEANRLGLQYRALCDIGIFSCTKVFGSEFGHISQFFGLPKVSNAFVGMTFYMALLLVERFNTMLLLMSVASCIGSVGLFTILTVVMKDFCIVCFSIYVVNFTCLIVALRRRRASLTSPKSPNSFLKNKAT